jgi:hypothetical protein
MPDDLALSGLTAHIDPPDNSYGGMDILILGDLIRVDAGDLSWESFHEVSRETTGTSFDDWLNNRPPPRVLAVGWGAFPDSELGVVYLYDKTDGNFGYAINLDADYCSEWGTSPFPVDPAIRQVRRKEDYG